MAIHLEQYGLTDSLKREAATHAGLFIARVSEQHRDFYRVLCRNGEMGATVSGKLAYLANDQTAFPAVGDWVMVDRTDESGGCAVIHHILCRKSVLTRQAVGTEAVGQVIAANIDIIFICMSLNADFNLRRMERYLTMAWDSMATPVIVLTKSDVCDDLPQKLSEMAAVSIGVDVIHCSCENGSGLEDIRTYLGQDRTIAFVGSSGVGKSTLINRLIGRNVLATSEIRPDDAKGRHTTTHRQLLPLPDGGVVIDTPGMRELQMYTGDLSKSFEDVEQIAVGCKFADCSHTAEPDCAIKAAIETGALSEKRFESYQKLRRELNYSGMNARLLENEKINRMFGGKEEMKRMRRHLKEKRR